MKKFFSGNSIEQVVLTAARHFGVEPERLAYTVRDKKHGFTNVRRKVVIEVDPDNFELSAEQAAAQVNSGEASGVEKLSGRGIPKELKDGIPLPGEGTAYGEDAGSDEDADRNEIDEDDRYDESDESDEDDSYDDEEDESDEDDSYDDEDDDDEEEDDEDDDEEEDDEDDDDEEEDDDDDDRGRRERGRSRGRGRSSRRDRGHGGRRADFIHRWEGGGLDDDEVAEVGQEIAAFELALDAILDVMDLEIEFTITEGDTYEVEFSGEDADLLTAEDGRALKAVEHVLPRAVRTLLGETLPVKVDCEGFRADHEDELMQAARDAADEVRSSGREVRLAPMGPGDRRIVHLTLADDPEVDTFSEGRGYKKRVTVRPID